MEFLKNKCREEKGASVLIAMALLLICMMVSSVILVAAAAGSSRNSQRIRSQQEYYSLRFAAELLMDELTKVQGKKYIGREQVEVCSCSDSNLVSAEKEFFADYGKDGHKIHSLGVEGISEPMILELCPQKDWEKISYKDEEENSINEILDSQEESLMKDSIEFLIVKATQNFYLSGINDFEEEFVIKVPDGEERLRNVNCRVLMDDSYGFTWYLTVENSNYAVTITMEANIILAPEEGFLTKELGNQGHEGIYKKNVGGITGVDIIEGDISLIKDLHYKDTVVSWKKPVLEKGVENP